MPGICRPRHPEHTGLLSVRTLTVYFKALTGEGIVPGVIVAVQTFGERLLDVSEIRTGVDSS